MSKKSIFEIEIKDEAFKSFVALFQKYQDALGEMPDQWAKVGKENIKASKGFDGNVQALNKINSAQKKVSGEQEKFNKQTINLNRNLTNIAKTTGGIAKSIASATASLAKWGALGLGAGLLGAGGGLFGLSNLASGASQTRRDTRSMGLSTGELRSAETNFSKFFGQGGTAQVLERINEAKSDPTKAGAFRLLGIDQSQVNNLNPAELLSEVISKTADRYRTLPQGAEKTTYESMGLNSLIDFDKAKQLASYDDKELQSTRALYEQGIKQYQLTDKQLANWQKLEISLDSAGKKIKTTFLDQLEPLSSNLSNLSDKFSDAVNAFIKNPQMAEWIDSFSQSLGRAAEYLGGDKVKQDVDRFLTAIQRLGDGIYKTAKFFGLVDETEEEKKAEATRKKAVSQAFNAYKAPVAQDVAFLSELSKQAGFKGNILDEMWAAESGRGRNMLSSAGAMGHFQFMPQTAKSYGLSDPNNFVDSSMAAQKMMMDLQKQYGGDTEKSLAAYNYGSGNLNNAMKKYGADYKQNLPAETKNYIYKIMGNMNPSMRPQLAKEYNIRVSNTAGSDLVVNAAQVAQ